MKQNKFWIILIAVFLLLSVIASAFVFLYHGSGNTVAIYQDGVLIDKIHLDTVTTPYEMKLETQDGGYNIIHVEQGRICVSEASCPDHVCVNTGWLTDGAIPIVCLPNELVIQIDSKNSGTVDGAAQ